MKNLNQTLKNDGQGFPLAGGLLLGLGLGGFFDGIILHQVLQWHHMLTSAGFPPNTAKVCYLIGKKQQPIPVSWV